MSKVINIVIVCGLLLVLGVALLGLGVIESPLGDAIPSGFLLPEPPPELVAFHVGVHVEHIVAAGPVAQMANAMGGRPYTSVTYEVIQPQFLEEGSIDFYVIAPITERQEIERQLVAFGNLQ